MKVGIEIKLDREKLAALAHEQWSGWMQYLFGQCSIMGTDGPNGKTASRRMIIPEWAVERWTRQMSTPYEELSEEEKESDRKEADRVIQLIKESNHES